MATMMNKYDRQHIRNISAYERQIDEIYKEAVKEAAAIGVSISDFNPDRLFTFDDYPATRKRIDRLLSGLKKDMTSVVVNGVNSEWTLSNNKNNELSRMVFGDNVGKLTKEQYRRYFSTNDNARKAFLNRVENGLKLSDRVWKYTDQFKAEIELGLDVGIRNGLSADVMTRELRDYLRHTDKLFRRVRDEHGILQLSKRAAAFHPGQGVYRSSYKNARRLAATETNIAYRTADYTRWQDLDFVVGIEIKLSNNHTLNGVPFSDICDELKGKYPKNFKFTGWHPHCRCHAVTILKTEEELMADNELIMAGGEPNENSKNSITDVPDNYQKWMTNNAGRINRAKHRGTLPYFIRDNKAFMNVNKNTETFNDIFLKSEQEADDKLRDVAGKVWSEATDEERKSIYYYTMNEYSNINYILRTELRHRDQSSIDVMNMISRSKYNEDFVLRRGCKEDELKIFSLTKDDLSDLDKLKEKAIGRKGVYENFLSASAAEGKGRIRNIEYHIQAKKGTEMIYAEPFSGNGKGFELNWDGKQKQKLFSEEQEVIINQGYEYEIIDVEQYINYKGTNVTRFIIRVLDRRKTKVKK